MDFMTYGEQSFTDLGKYITYNKVSLQIHNLTFEKPTGHLLHEELFLSSRSISYNPQSNGGKWTEKNLKHFQYARWEMGQSESPTSQVPLKA